ncbi:RHS repeat-associated core domain-containing protein, partial [Photorhabdus hainanensis]|uniref:RHS repeat-associated core domain-containing protein n=1 Tax=Photorhabdus hainanensis TaxID=1004166 RepID=UPI002484BBF3
AALNLTAVSDDGQPLNYLLNGNGQVMSVGEGRTLREHYQYDETGYPSRRFDGVQEIMGETLYQEGHRLNWVDSHRFVYDRAGRMREKQFLAEGCRLALTKYRWNSQNQLTGLITPDGIPWEYRYDAFGRRTEKRCIQSGKRTTYLWDGDTPAEIREYQHGRLKMIRHLVFDGWELIAQQTQAFTLNLDNRVELMAGEVQTQYAVSAPTGEPLALFDPEGKRVWRRPKQSLYGLRLTGPGENPQLDPGLRFAGQLFDEESGLFYNRFRYYLPEATCYLSPDPLGLAGGVNPYSYVHNPTGWIDPFGLNPKDLVRYKIHNTVTPKLGARGTAINRAWGQERALVTAGGGSRNWTDAERQIILNTKSNRKLASIMSERGYTGHHINSVKGNGTLGQAWKGDPRNIVFLQNANHPSGVDEHLYSNQGHRGSYDTPGNGRLIDREATSKQIVKKCGR